MKRYLVASAVLASFAGSAFAGSGCNYGMHTAEGPQQSKAPLHVADTSVPQATTAPQTELTPEELLLLKQKQAALIK
jgi:hypothetical protein